MVFIILQNPSPGKNKTTDDFTPGVINKLSGMH